MAKAAGRKSIIKKAGVTIAGVRVTGLSLDSTPIDITDNDSAGLQVLLADSAFQVLSLNVSGVESDHILRDIALDTAQSQLLTDITFTFADSPGTKDVLAGSFYMTNYKEDNDFKDAVQFSATFTSSGAWTRA
jgi:predicted secreted protein